MILAPLRGVSVRCFRETFAHEIAEAGFTAAITPFIAANRGYDPLRDRELRQGTPFDDGGICPCARPEIIPQFIGKDPVAFAESLRRIADAGFTAADLNAGCPFPMVRNKGRGSGLLRSGDTLRRMLEAGCEALGPGRLSLKARLGVERKDELASLMPVINEFPIRFLTVHARTARQMYTGECDRKSFDEVAAVARMKVVYNGDVPFSFDAPPPDETKCEVMVGRAFVRALGSRADASQMLERYAENSRSELFGDRPVLGRLKELVSYWSELPAWRRRWQALKISRTTDEFLSAAS